MVGAILVALLVGAAGTERADLPAAQQATFKRLVLAGEEAFGRGEPGIAIALFRMAERIRPTPEVAYNLAKVHELLNDPATTAYYFRLYLRRAPEAPDSADVAQTVGALLHAAEARGEGLLELESPLSGWVRVDNALYPELPAAAFVSEGPHRVDAGFADGRPHGTDVEVTRGRVTVAVLEPVPPPLLEAEGGPSAVSFGDGGLRRAGQLTSYGLLGAAGAALVAGLVVGGMSRGDLDSLENRSALTVSQARTTAERASARGGTANTLFILGGAGALAGGALFVFTLPEPGGVK